MNSSSQLKRIESPFDFNTNNSNNSKTIRYQNTCNSAQLKNEHFNIKKFKSVIKKEHLKKLNQYKESLDKKIAELKEKLLENNSSDVSCSNYESFKVNDNTKLNYKKFYDTILSNEKNCNSILSFLNSNDLYRILNVNKQVHQSIIKNLIKEILEIVVPRFMTKYNNNILFSNSSFSMIVKKYKKNKKMNVRFILSIKSTVTSNNKYLYNRTYQIGYTTCVKQNEKTITSYTFEIIPNTIPKQFWIFREYTDFHFDELDKSYYNNIVQFSPGDIVNISLSIFSEIGLLNLSYFHWLKPIEYKSKDRDCEVEYLKNIWNDLNLLDDWESIFKSIHEIFGKYFEIKKILFDDVGYYLFKIYLIANTIGKIKANENEYIGMNINIVGKGETIENEVKKNGLIFDEKNELTIRLEDSIVFYISRSK